MRHSRFARTAVPPLLAAALLVPAAPATSAPVRPPCNDVAVSPGFARDRTALCGRLHFDGTTMVLALYRTRDGGRTWAAAKATGLLVEPTASFGVQFQFSPSFATDRRLFVATSSGLFATTDLGETFTVVDSALQWSGIDNPGVYGGSAGSLAPMLPGRRAFVAYAAGVRSARLDIATGLHQPVAGVASGTTRAFVLPGIAAPAAPILAVSSQQKDPAKPDVTYSLWTCNDDLVCADRRYEFETGFSPLRFWRIPLAGGRSDLAVLAGRGFTYRAYLSSDNGATFRRWTSLERAIAPMAKAMAPQRVPALGLATNPARPGHVFLRVVGDMKLSETRWSKTAPPREQLFRSDDGGATWRRVAYGRGLGQPGAPGNIPWNTPSPGVSYDYAAVVMASDGRLLVPAAREGQSGIVPGSGSVYCSLDGGVRWSPTCPR